MYAGPPQGCPQSCPKTPAQQVCCNTAQTCIQAAKPVPGLDSCDGSYTCPPGQICQQPVTGSQNYNGCCCCTQTPACPQPPSAPKPVSPSPIPAVPDVPQCPQQTTMCGGVPYICAPKAPESKYNECFNTQQVCYPVGQDTRSTCGCPAPCPTPQSNCPTCLNREERPFYYPGSANL
ncbi:MAG: hypothetical protein LBR73_08525 [Oscillospiraceae bacterium]|nr:hypothetical protein [Oscillospiraceae bacterium]